MHMHARSTKCASLFVWNPHKFVTTGRVHHEPVCSITLHNISGSEEFLSTNWDLPRPANYPLLSPKYPLIRTIRALLQAHWGVRYIPPNPNTPTLVALWPAWREKGRRASREPLIVGGARGPGNRRAVEVHVASIHSMRFRREGS